MNKPLKREKSRAGTSSPELASYRGKRLNKPFKTIRHLLLLATAAAALCPGDAWADKVSFITSFGASLTADAKQITSSGTVTLQSDSSAPEFYVSGDVTISGDLTLEFGTTGSSLILCDGAKLTITGKLSTNNNLNICAQSTGDNMGKLIVESSEDNAIFIPNTFDICGGDISVISGGITSKKITLESCRLTADRLIKNSESEGGLEVSLFNATDFFKVNNFNINRISKPEGNLRSFLADGTTSLVFNTSGEIPSSDWTQLEGKKITLAPSCLFEVTLPTSTPGGTVAADPALAPQGRNVTLSFTPAAGNLLTAASWNDGTSDNVISLASPTSNALSRSFSMPAANVTVNATFATPVAQIGDTKYASLAAALAAVNDGETITILSDKDESATNYDFTSDGDSRSVTINMNGCTYSFGNISNKRSDLKILGPGTINFGHFDNQGEFLFKDVTVNCKYIDNPGAAGTITFDNAKAVCNSGVAATNSIQLYGADQSIVLKNGSDVEIDLRMFVGYNDNFTLDIQDAASILKLRNCIIGYMEKPYVEDEFLQYIRPDQKAGFSTDLASGNPVTLDLRASWGLMLTDNFGGNATVTFYAGGTSEPTGFDVTNPGETIVTANPGDWIVAHIVPDPGYWTDLKLLMVYEAGGALARRRSLDMTDPYKPKLLQADTYEETDMFSGISTTKPLHNGAGWYYYQIPTEHTIAQYTSNVVDGSVVKQFDLNKYTEGNSVVQDATTKTITVSRTADDWTAEISLDANTLSFPFDGNGHAPTITGITVKKGTQAMMTLTSDFSNQLTIYEAMSIGENPIYLNEVSFSWFTNNLNDENITFAITVPFNGSGTESAPWQITNAAELNMLAKCVNLGQYDFSSKFLKQTASFSMSEINDFIPIGALKTGFNGSYNGNGNTISNLTTIKTDVNYTSDDYSEFMTVGLFGRVGETGKSAVIEDVKLSGCVFDDSKLTEAHIPVISVGGAVGLLHPDSKVSKCIVSSSTIKGSDKNASVGGIVGTLGIVMMTPVSARAVNSVKKRSTASYSIENCVVDGCTISNMMTGAGESNKNYTGGIVGMAIGGSIGGNRVTGTTTITSDVNNNTDCPIGAIYGMVTSTTSTSSITTLSNNTYDKDVNVKYKKGSMSSYTEVTGYSPRGYRKDANTFADVTDDAGAMLYVKPATISLTNGGAATSAVAFSQTVAGTDCYAKETTGGKDYIYYAPGDNIVLNATYHQSVDDGRTFYESVTVDVNDDENIVVTPSVPTQNGTEYACTFTFAMPDDDATVNAIVVKPEWFTIASNGKKWMTFYHDWKDANNAAANYTVTDGSGTEKKITVSTITAIDAATGAITKKPLEGVSFSGVPTLFNCDGNLPAVLKFTPETSKTAPTDVATQFKGVATATALSGDGIYIMNGDGSFDHAYIKSGANTLAAHRCYIDLGSATGAARLYFVEEAVTSVGEVTGVTDVTEMSEDWYTLDGRRLNGQPTRKGIYIYKGKKTVVR